MGASDTMEMLGVLTGLMQRVSCKEHLSDELVKYSAVHNEINIPDIQYYSNTACRQGAVEGKVQIRSAY
jgi:hypothetical protein